MEEIRNMKKLCVEAMDILKTKNERTPEELLKISDHYEQEIDDMEEALRQNQIDRMGKGTCTAEASILYSEMLTDFERIGDHVLNIAEAHMKMTV